MYSLSTFTLNNEQRRIYINGTSRKKVYFMQAGDGRMVWSSKENDTPAKYATGDHYGKIKKDRQAAIEVAEAYGLKLGEADEFDRAWSIANDGVQVEA